MDAGLVIKTQYQPDIITTQIINTATTNTSITMIPFLERSASVVLSWKKTTGWPNAIARFFVPGNCSVLNVVSSPGSGKTLFIRETALRLAGNLRVGVIVGDLATDNDAARLRTAGIPVVQITTGTVCHLDAAMVARAAAELDLGKLDVLIIENVGNLVCPADYDLGENLRIVLLSVTEGEDKPLKYPPIFHSANAAVITKTDLAFAAGFDRAATLANLKRISHHARIFELSARTGDGMKEWLDFLEQQHAVVNGNEPSLNSTHLQ